MSKKRIAIIGAGGFGREVYSFLDKEFECIGFIDFQKEGSALPKPILGHEENIEELIEKHNFSDCALTIGDMSNRAAIYERINEFSIEFPQIIHSSVVSTSTDIGNGTVIYPGVVIMNDCNIGSFSLINSGVTIGHDVVIGDFCNINPGVNLAGRILIGERTLIGIGATVKENITIGNNCVIGAGSVVLKDVPDNTTVYGVPAK